MFAAQEGFLEVVRILIENGADVNDSTGIGETALMFAVEKGHNDIASLLIENGADINAQDIYQRTALMRASASGNVAMVSYLIEKDADVNLKDKQDKFALDFAKKFEYQDVVDLLSKLTADTTGSDSTGLAVNDSTAQVNYDKPPQPEGGLEAIQKKLRIPRSSRRDGIVGTVTVKVLISTEGKVLETKIEKSLEDEQCDKAAIDAIEKVSWVPATKDDEPVEAWISVPVKFEADR